MKYASLISYKRHSKVLNYGLMIILIHSVICYVSSSMLHSWQNIKKYYTQLLLFGVLKLQKSSTDSIKELILQDH